MRRGCSKKRGASFVVLTKPACERAAPFGSRTNPSGGGVCVILKSSPGRQVVRRSSCRQRRGRDENIDLGTVYGGRPGLRHDLGRGSCRSSRSASRTLYTRAASRRGHSAVHLFVAGASAVAAALPEPLRLLSGPLHLCRPLRSHVPNLRLLAGVVRLLSRGSWLVRRRRRPALRDVAVGISVSVQLRGATE